MAEPVSRRGWLRGAFAACAGLFAPGPETEPVGEVRKSSVPSPPPRFSRDPLSTVTTVVYDPAQAWRVVEPANDLITYAPDGTIVALPRSTGLRPGPAGEAPDPRSG